MTHAIDQFTIESPIGGGFGPLSFGGIAVGRWFQSFEAKNPTCPDIDRWTVGVTEKKVRQMAEQGDAVRLSRLQLAQIVVADPLLIFRGWDRPNTDDCFVYAGKPATDYRGVGIETPPPPNQFFLVFVLEDGTIDFWTWRECRDDDLTLPAGIQGEPLWRQTPN